MKPDNAVLQAFGADAARPPATAAGTWRFAERTHSRLFAGLGARPDLAGFCLAGWALKARAFSLVGESSHWDVCTEPLMQSGTQNGTWRGQVPADKVGDHCKFKVTGTDGRVTLNADPRASRAAQHEPVSVYQRHPGSEWLACDDVVARVIAVPAPRA